MSHCIHEQVITSYFEQLKIRSLDTICDFEKANQNRMSFGLHIGYYPKFYPFAQDGVIPNHDTASHLTVVMGTKDVFVNVTDRFQIFAYLEFIGFHETGEVAIIKKDLRKLKAEPVLIRQVSFMEMGTINPENSITDFLLPQLD